MRDLTKVMFSYSWAMSLLGVQQAVNLMNPPKAIKTYDNVTQAVRREFDDITEKTFAAGNDLQQRFMSMTMGMFNLDALNPSKVMRVTHDMTQKAADCVNHTIRSSTASRGEKKVGR